MNFKDSLLQFVKAQEAAIQLIASQKSGKKRPSNDPLYPHLGTVIAIISQIKFGENEQNKSFKKHKCLF